MTFCSTLWDRLYGYEFIAQSTATGHALKIDFDRFFAYLLCTQRSYQEQALDPAKLYPNGMCVD